MRIGDGASMASCKLAVIRRFRLPRTKRPPRIMSVWLYVSVVAITSSNAATRSHVLLTARPFMQAHQAWRSGDCSADWWQAGAAEQERKRQHDEAALARADRERDAPSMAGERHEIRRAVCTAATAEPDGPRRGTAGQGPVGGALGHETTPTAGSRRGQLSGTEVPGRNQRARTESSSHVRAEESPALCLAFSHAPEVLQHFRLASYQREPLSVSSSWAAGRGRSFPPCLSAADAGHPAPRQRLLHVAPGASRRAATACLHPTPSAATGLTIGIHDRWQPRRAKFYFTVAMQSLF
jgi:hypothetical protein